jgi:hypothetical protein
MPKQTAVEWLINEMHKKQHGLTETSYNHLFDQAKAMEKEQIGRAYQEGLIDGMNHTPKDYYNKTYGGEDARLD